MNHSRFALRNDKFVFFVVIVLAVLGIRAYVLTPQSIFPNMTFSRVDVIAEVGDLPPDQVRVSVTRPLERIFQTLPAVTNVLATSSQGSAELVVNFSASTDPRVDLQYVDQAISEVRSDISVAKRISSAIVNPNREPILSYALTSPELSQAVLREIAMTQIVPKLYGVAGLGGLLVTGGPSAEYHVTLDPAKLAAQSVGAADVGRALADANTVQAVGQQQRYYQQYAVIIDSSLRDAAALAGVSIPLKNGAAVPLSALGRVSLGVSPVTDQTSLDGQHAVLINVFGLAGADTVKLADTLRTRLASIHPTLPRNMSLTNFWDQTTLIVDSQATLRDAILIGALLAVIVIYIFLRSLRLTLVAAAVIPLAMSIAIFALQQAGQTLNLMTVGGLAVAVGLIIDDAIVVIENIERNVREQPALPIEAAIDRSMSQLTTAMIASTATTVVVFLPLALLTGVTGFFFRALAFTLSVSLMVSLGLALLIAPIIARRLLANQNLTHRKRDSLGAILDRYDPLLRWSLGRRTLVVAASAGVLLVTFLLMSRLPSDFLPKMDEGQFEINYTMPTGTTLQASDAAATQMERIIAADGAVGGVGRLTGIDSNGVSPTQANQGLLRVRLIAANKRDSFESVSARLREKLAAAVPAALFDFHQILEDIINDLSGSPAPIEIAVSGTDQATLIALAQRIADAISKVGGVVDPSNGVVYEPPLLRIAPRGTALAAQGLTAQDVADAVAALGTGVVSTNLAGPQQTIPVRVSVRPANAAANDLIDANTSLYAKGSTTAVGTIASITPVRLSSAITTSNGQLQIRVSANYQNASLSAVTAGIRRALKSVPMPPGYATDIGGQAQTQAQSFAEFIGVIGIAVALVFAVMLATFRSFRLPLVILTAIPLALIGVALGLYLTGTHFNVSSFMGLLLLVGVVVKNGILLVDVANRQRANGATVEEALIAAGKTRLRPIVMTTLAAIGGLFPLALGIGQGSEMEKPLAIAVIGGLSTATIFTLIVIPVLYAAFCGWKPPVAAAHHITAVLFAAICIGVTGYRASAQPTADTPQPQTFRGLSVVDAVAAAVANSPDVAGARARFEQNRYAFFAARDNFAPSLAASYAQVPQGNPPGPNIVSRAVTVGLQWALGDFLTYRPAVREAAFTLNASQADLDAAVITERVRAAGLYFDALKARAVVVARTNAAALAEAERDAARLRSRAGDAPHLDVVRSDVAVARAEADVEVSRALDTNATEALRSETAGGPDALAETSQSTFSAVNSDLTDVANVAGLARRFRPEIASARLSAQAADAAATGARAAGFPAIALTGGYLIGTDSGVPINAPSINANLTLPLSRAAHDRVGIAVAKAAEAQSKAVGVERSIVLEAAALARTLGGVQRATAAMTRARESASLVLRATDIGYRSGASSSLELTNARATYAQAVVDELSAVYDLEKARVQLEIEVGR